MVANWEETQTGPLAIGAFAITTYFHFRTGAPPFAFNVKITAAGMGCQAAIETERWLAEHGG